MKWPVNLDDFETEAKRQLDPMVHDYVAGGAADERTLQLNREAFAGIRLKPRVLVDVSRVDMGVELLNQKLKFPILLAPTAYHKLLHPEGECATARGAGAAGATLVVSTYATTPIEIIAKVASSPLWFQIYVTRDRSFTCELVARAEVASCSAVCLTVDSAVMGIRNRDARSGFHLPKGIIAEHLKRTIGDTQDARSVPGRTFETMIDPSLSWKDVDWLCSLAKVPVVIKGVLSPEDACLAIDHGAAGIIVSNHGGRNLDTAPASIDALPGVIEAVSGRVPVLLDGGIRRGTDVLKALAFGARAVLIGRPYLWGLSVAGAEGVAEVVRILVDELSAAMALCGTPSVADITRDSLWGEQKRRTDELQRTT